MDVSGMRKIKKWDGLSGVFRGEKQIRNLGVCDREERGESCRMGRGKGRQIEGGGSSYCILSIISLTINFSVNILKAEKVCNRVWWIYLYGLEHFYFGK